MSSSELVLHNDPSRGETDDAATDHESSKSAAADDELRKRLDKVLYSEVWLR